ncbi:hypothetical protein F2Q68_00003387 [Brassica cretica]|uniref:Uncharacterized protein n=1 Tax=Brassica cretica TaxID=69181 RepID=A0A8S9JA34_BRACR|nr:hypothetical protein F2Q68_00003387 [Brassica cretica]
MLSEFVGSMRRSGAPRQSLESTPLRPVRARDWAGVAPVLRSGGLASSLGFVLEHSGGVVVAHLLGVELRAPSVFTGRVWIRSRLRCASVAVKASVWSTLFLRVRVWQPVCSRAGPSMTLPWSARLLLHLCPPFSVGAALDVFCGYSWCSSLPSLLAALQCSPVVYC